MITDSLREKILEQIGDLEIKFSKEAEELQGHTGRKAKPEKVCAYGTHEVVLDGGSRRLLVRVGNSNLSRFNEKSYAPLDVGYRSYGALELGMFQLGEELGLRSIRI